MSQNQSPPAPALAQALETILAQEDDAPQDQTQDQDSGLIGYWQLRAIEDLAVTCLSCAADQTGDWLSWNAYCQKLEDKPRKPTSPQPDDPRFDPPGVAYDTPEEQDIAKRYRYQKAAKQHAEDLRLFEDQTRQADDWRRQFGSTPTGYLAYVQNQFAGANSNPITAFLDQQRPLFIPEAAARYGSFIVGNHGSGKSEVIKQRVWHYLSKPQPEETLIVIDPHGELAPEIARMKPNLNSDRLVYLDPTLDPEFVPCPDLLNTADKSADNLYLEAEHYGSALRMMAGHVEPSATGNMESLCRNCAHLILEHDRFNLADLLDLLAVETGKKDQTVEHPPAALTAAQTGSINPWVHKHFAEHFLSARYTLTRSALYGRLERILTAPLLQRMLLSKPSFHLDTLIEQRKIIVINLPFKDLSEPVTAMLGQLMMAQIVLAILKRDLPRIADYPPVHVFIDEAQHLVSFETANQINELRKFGFGLHLATQYVDQFPSKILEAVKGLGVQIAGYCEGGNLEAMNAVFDLKASVAGVEAASRLKNQAVGEFTLKSRSAPGVKAISTRQFKTDTHLLFKDQRWKEANAANFMSEEEWESVKAEQLRRYYRPVSPEIKEADSESPSDTPDQPAPTQRPSKTGFRPLEPDLGYGD